MYRRTSFLFHELRKIVFTKPGRTGPSKGRYRPQVRRQDGGFPSLRVGRPQGAISPQAASSSHFRALRETHICVLLLFSTLVISMLNDNTQICFSTSNMHQHRNRSRSFRGWLAVHQFQCPCPVAGTHHGVGRQQRAQLIQVIGCQFNIGGGGIFLEVFGPLGAWNGNDMGILR